MIEKSWLERLWDYIAGAPPDKTVKVAIHPDDVPEPFVIEVPVERLRDAAGHVLARQIDVPTVPKKSAERRKAKAAGKKKGRGR